jgi:choline dehydrogenase-like flavoprotein
MIERGEFDYVIVGGGSAGCVLAARLSENPFVRVCLLEAGPADKSVLLHCPAGLALLAKNGAYNWAFETVPQPGLGGRRGYQPRGKVLGGSSSVNAMIYVRGQPEDYDGWASEGNHGWGWHDVLPYFRRAEHNERGSDAFHGQGGPLNVMDLRSPHRFGPVFVEAAQQAGHAVQRRLQRRAPGRRRPLPGDAQERRALQRRQGYLTPNLARTNLHVITGATTTKIRLDGGRATGVEARIDGVPTFVPARREVLLSAARCSRRSC